MPDARFDFETLHDRSKIASAKWARRSDAEKAEGVVPMSVADMEFACAPCIIEAVRKAADFGLYGYTDADDRYYEAIIGWMQRRHGWTVEREWILPENGVVPALCVAVRAFSEPGEGVLIQSPGYPPFSMAVETNGRKAVYNALVPDDDGVYHMDMSDLREKAARPDVRLMILCSPHNPVGRLWTVEELRIVAEICAENDVILVSDEIHSDLEIHGRHTVLYEAAPVIRDRCAILTAPSKTFNLAGLQLANTIIPDAGLRERFRARMTADGVGNVPYFGYHATIAAYTDGAPWLDALLEQVRSNFDMLGAWLAENLPAARMLPAEGTYLAWVDFRRLGLSQKALDALMEKARLVPTNGRFFGEGGEGFMRLNLALPREALADALSRLRAAL